MGSSTAYPPARELPELRAELTAWLRDPGPDGGGAWFRFALAVQENHRPGSVGDPARAAAEVHRHLAATVPAAELFYVAADMTALAHHAAASLPDYRLRREDLPAPCGLMAFEHAPRRGRAGLGVRLVTWGPDPAGLGVHYWGHPATDTAEPLRVPSPGPDPAARAELAELARDIQAAGAAIPPHPTPAHGHLYAGAVPIPFADTATHPGTPPPSDAVHPPVANADPPAVTDDDVGEVLRVVVATWLLMGQTITTHHREEAPRAGRRRITRVDPALTTAVRTVTLRRARTDADPDQAHVGRAWQHRWVVGGHWRTYRDARFSEEVRERPTWIHPHIKGPDGAPLLGGDRVRILKR